jgi:ketose-bisphosphate aldolase
MPIANLRPFLEDAKKNRYCLGCFNVFNVETLEGAVEAAINLQTPVVCAVYEPHLKYSDLGTFTNLVKDISNKVNVPLILHLDHATEISSIINAIKCGFTSLMYDGPIGLDFEEKIKRTKQVVDIVHSVGLMVEAEVGYITKVGLDEGSVGANLTNAKMAVEFVERTGVDVLAPAIGTIHGLKEQKASLNLDLLKQIRQLTDCFLSLHGGSGVDDSIVQQAIDCGINKVSVYTRISTVAVRRLKELLLKDSPDLAIILNEVRNGYREMIENRLAVFKSINICSFRQNICQLSFVGSYEKTDIWSNHETSYRSSNDTNYTSSNVNDLIEEITKQILSKLKIN